MDGAAGDGTSLSLTALMEAQPLLGVVVKFNEALLREEQGGRNVLISRLAEVIKVSCRLGLPVLYSSSSPLQLP